MKFAVIYQILIKAKKQSAETIAKRISKNIGRKRTPEQIERIKEGQRLAKLAREQK